MAKQQFVFIEPTFDFEEACDFQIQTSEGAGYVGGVSWKQAKNQARTYFHSLITEAVEALAAIDALEKPPRPRKVAPSLPVEADEIQSAVKSDKGYHVGQFKCNTNGTITITLEMPDGTPRTSAVATYGPELYSKDSNWYVRIFDPKPGREVTEYHCSSSVSASLEYIHDYLFTEYGINASDIVGWHDMNPTY